MHQKLHRFQCLYFSLFIILFSLFLLASCDRGVTIHPSKLTPEMQKECAAALAGLYDVRVHIISTIARTEREVRFEDGKRVENFESQDTTLELSATILDYDNGMKLILHDFPLSTVATALPDSLGDLRTAIADESDKELTIGYQFSYSDQLYLVFTPHDLPFTCHTPDGRQHRLRLSFRSDFYWSIGTLEDRVMNINLILDKKLLQFSATALYEDERSIFAFDEWTSDDFYTVSVKFGGR